MSNFIDACARGDARPDAVDEEVEAWHHSDSVVPLHVYLGMTQDEYDAWIADPSILPRLIDARRRNSRTG